MYCSSSSATHHIFFPPRLQVVALQQNPDCLPPRFGDQFAFDRFLDDQTHGPARPTFRRLTADHGNDTLAELTQSECSHEDASLMDAALESTDQSSKIF